jgi:putative addiction module killer protein
VEAIPRIVDTYQIGNSVPFNEWLAGLKDARGKGQIEARINKLRRGLRGEYDDVGEGVLELILDNVGPGYRIYCADDGKNALLLCGGNKRTQDADILRAKKMWREYKSRNA